MWSLCITRIIIEQCISYFVAETTPPDGLFFPKAFCEPQMHKSLFSHCFPLFIKNSLRWGGKHKLKPCFETFPRNKENLLVTPKIHNSNACFVFLWTFHCRKTLGQGVGQRLVSWYSKIHDLSPRKHQWIRHLGQGNGDLAWFLPQTPHAGKGLPWNLK